MRLPTRALLVMIMLVGGFGAIATASSPSWAAFGGSAFMSACAREAQQRLWVQFALIVLVFFGLAWPLGRLAIAGAAPVAATRKIFALMLLVVPPILVQYPAFLGIGPEHQNHVRGEISRCVHTLNVSLDYFAVSGFFVQLVALLCFCCFWRPIRSRFQFLNTCFAAIDRPEDRPHTLTWIVTSFLATYAVMGLITFLLFAKFLPGEAVTALILIAAIASGIGDALAEPVGRYLGRH